ncbi:MAG: HEAT repeat domain-containing protein, partial [Deltaproteobacteria bacterium]|nr:HEAT repeat domain-containing protein [Deltaproteobacteria bacterium]
MADPTPTTPGTDELLAGLRSDDWRVRRAAAAALLTENRPEAWRELLLRLRGAGDDPHLPAAAMQVLSAAGFDPGPAMESLTEDDRPEVRVYAAQLLAHLPGEEAFGLLTRLARDPDANVRFSALEALGVQGRPEALWPLVRALHSQDPFEMMPALGGLGALGDPLAEASVLESLVRAEVRAA